MAYYDLCRELFTCSAKLTVQDPMFNYCNVIKCSSKVSSKDQCKIIVRYVLTKFYLKMCFLMFTFSSLAEDLYSLLSENGIICSIFCKKLH